MDSSRKVSVDTGDAIVAFERECRDFVDFLDECSKSLEDDTDQLGETWRDSEFSKVAVLSDEIKSIIDRARAIAEGELLPHVSAKLESLENRPNASAGEFSDYGGQERLRTASSKHDMPVPVKELADGANEVVAESSPSSSEEAKAAVDDALMPDEGAVEATEEPGTAEPAEAGEDEAVEEGAEEVASSEESASPAEEEAALAGESAPMEAVVADDIAAEISKIESLERNHKKAVDFVGRIQHDVDNPPEKKVDARPADGYEVHVIIKNSVASVREAKHWNDGDCRKNQDQVRARLSHDRQFNVPGAVAKNGGNNDKDEPVMSDSRIDLYRRRIYPHYKAICDNDEVCAINEQRELSLFCTQWGSNWRRGDSILFVGRATNGWDGGLDADAILNLKNTLFNAEDQMRWIDDVWTDQPQGSWSGARSPFWRVIRAVTERQHPDEWYSHIAWSNLCRVSFKDKGNPTDPLFWAQKDECRELLKIDVEELRPRVVVMITDYENWGHWFTDVLVGNAAPVTFSHKGCSVNVLRGNGNVVVVCDRPEGHSEVPLVECIAKVCE